jgi:hypothetical protein
MTKQIIVAAIIPVSCGQINNRLNIYFITEIHYHNTRNTVILFMVFFKIWRSLSMRKFFGIILGYLIGFGVLLLIGIDITLDTLKIFLFATIIGLVIGAVVNRLCKKR